MTYIDGSRAVGRISTSLVIPIMKTVRSDSYQCRLSDYGPSIGELHLV